jgi:phenylalanyl-tRNA synthetase alpha chain
MSETNILQELETIQQAGLDALAPLENEEALQTWRTAHLGRSAPVMLVFQKLGTFDAALRPQVGQAANKVKVALETAFNERTQAVKEQALAHALANEKLDITLPGRPIAHGRLHPDTQILRELYRIFGEMGFQVYRSREVETDEYNFQNLNFAVGHPARDMQDTYFVDAGERGDNPIVMRTHTSPGQVHAMQEASATNPLNPPPVRIVLPGMCYRYEQTDARHETQFDQIEGLAVGPGITFTNLKATLSDLARRLFGQDARTRFRASYFPFTEPSLSLTWNASSATARAARFAAAAGSRSAAAAWCTPMCCAMVAMTPSATPVSPLASARSVSPCCATASTTSVTSGKTTPVSWSNSRSSDQ